MEKEECIRLLIGLTGKKNIFFTNRGNSAIRLAMRYAKSQGFKVIHMPDQGGWITYPQYAKKLGLEINKIKTDYGFISEMDTEEAAIINSMPAYAFLLDMEKIRAGFLINDVSASIGNDQAKYGDIIVGSFGRWKPIDVEYGGFLATDIDLQDFYDEHFKGEIEDFYPRLLPKLEGLKDRVKKLEGIRDEIAKDLVAYDILHPEKKGLNLIVKFSDLKERENLIRYCENKNIEHTLCPREIRVMCDAVSIEIKRLKGDN